MKWKSILLSGAALIWAGCATMNGSPAAVEINPSKDVQLTNISVKEDHGQFYVSGTLRPVSAAVRRTGHVDVEFIGAGGEVLETVRAEQHIRQFSRSSARRPNFSAQAELDPSQVDLVRLTHHVDTQQACEWQGGGVKHIKFPVRRDAFHASGPAKQVAPDEELIPHGCLGSEGRVSRVLTCKAGRSG